MYRSKKKAVSVLLSSALFLSSLSAMQPAIPASAADHNYGEALALSLYFFDSNACGTGITDGPLTWRGDCHTYDADASTAGLDGTAKSVVDPDNDGKVDLTGGYHDAGDHIKFNLTIGFGMQSLALSEYLNPGIYKKAGCEEHLHYILKRGADYMMKSTFLNSAGEVAAVAGTVADGNLDHAYWSAPEVQTYERKVFWLTASSNNSAVCCEMAAGLAGTAYVFKESDPTYAAECIKYAKALVKFASAHSGNNCEGMSFYSTNSMYQDEEALANAWLWILDEGTKPNYAPKNGDYGGGMGDWDKYQWDKVWQGFSVLMYKATGEDVYRDELLYEHNKNGITSSKFKGDAGWGNSRYNCAIQMTALALAGDDASSEYAKAAKYQMDCILGDNSLNYSFLIGYGDKWPTHIHHRAANPGDGTQTADSNMSAKYTNYGMLVGGINNDGYQDETNKYQYTEGALDYNGCFALACAGLYRLYGGDASAAKTIAQNASEINDTFFDSIAIQTTTTTEPTPIGTLRGDVDCSGDVDVSDAVLLARFLAEDSAAVITPTGLINANVDSDQQPTPNDVTMILRFIAKMIEL
ncbi:MAG TPA: glycosyl hydrolase family 5 [Ruminococcus sp.]|nr:glycosyl hydrolase family 5 [Ruminococcus sp.]